MSFIWSVYSLLQTEHKNQHASFSRITPYIEIHRPDKIQYSVSSCKFDLRARQFCGMSFFLLMRSVQTFEPNEVRKRFGHPLIYTSLREKSPYSELIISPYSVRIEENNNSKYGHFTQHLFKVLGHIKDVFFDIFCFVWDSSYLLEDVCYRKKKAFSISTFLSSQRQYFFLANIYDLKEISVN